MTRNRDEDELYAMTDAGDFPLVEGEGVWISDNMASQQIEDFSDFDPVDVDENPFMPQVTDNDGVPGFRPFADAARTFEEKEGLLNPEDNSEEEVVDEFAQRVKQHEEASVGADGKAVSDLSTLIRVDQAQQLATQAIAPYRRINPPTAARGLLGGKAKANPDERPVQVIHWEGEDVEALPVTLTLTPTYFPVAVEFKGPIRAFAEITWGTRDGVQTVRIDVGTGAQLTIGASVVYVSLGVNGGGGSVALTASFAFYTTEKNAPLTYTDAAVLAGGAATTFVRPNFASHVYFEREGSDPYTLRFLDVTGGIVLYERTIAGGAYLNEPVKLSSDVFYVSVTNGGGGGAQSSRLIWGLYL